MNMINFLIPFFIGAFINGWANCYESQTYLGTLSLAMLCAFGKTLMFLSIVIAVFYVLSVYHSCPQ